MLQIKTDDARGLALTDSQGQTFWLSPQRDLIHAYPIYMRKAVVLASARGNNPVVDAYYASGGSEEELQDYVVRIARFNKLCVMSNDKDMTVQDAAKEVGLEEASERVRAVIGYCVTACILGAYWAGVREARGSQPIPFLEEMDIVKLFREQPKGVIAWLKSKYLSMFRP